jgi:hypothetical protein
MKGIAIMSGLLASTVSAHMQLSTPYPIRSPLNKDAKGQKDYSYTNPLSSSGSDYPCKGYANDEFEAVATWAPGSAQHMELEGSAVHDGGSCQLALTYDQGKTFKVIESIEGDCPIAKKYDFNIPADAPAGNALFAWTWFNKVGNREMYMNCAMITIGGSGSRIANATSENEKREEMETPKHMVNHMIEEKPDMPMPVDKTTIKKPNTQPMEHAMKKPNTKPMEHTKNTKAASAGFDSLPELFVANVNQAGQCVTIEGEAVNFPEPGPNVLGKADGKGYKCSGNAPFLGSDASSSGASSNSSSNSNSSSSSSPSPSPSSSSEDEEDSTRNVSAAPASTPTAAHAATTSIKDKMSKIASAFDTTVPSADSRALDTEASTKNPFSSYVSGFRCADGEILCSPDGFTFAICDHGRPVFMGSVAAGTICRWGAITANR